MFGESISADVKHAAEEAIDGAGRLLVLATSLATYSAWRLAKRAKDRGMPIAIVNVGGVRGEEAFFTQLDPRQPGAQGVRVELSTQELLPSLVNVLQQTAPEIQRDRGSALTPQKHDGASAFKDMLS
jgi:NAD-dependent SIR2 family protein deacetylase